MKARPNKLDRFAAQLSELDAEKKTLSEICEWLAAEGCKASPSSVSVYLERLRSERRQAALLAQIASGAQQVKDVEKQFSKHEAPNVDVLIKLLRVQIMQLATKSLDNPDFLDITNTLTRTVMEFISGQTKAELEKQKLAHSERKIRLLEKKAEQADATERVLTDAELTAAEREQRIKEIYGRA